MIWNTKPNIPKKTKHPLLHLNVPRGCHEAPWNVHQTWSFQRFDSFDHTADNKPEFSANVKWKEVGKNSRKNMLALHKSIPPMKMEVEYDITWEMERLSLKRNHLFKMSMRVFPKIVVPQNGWFIMENPIKMDDLGVPLFLAAPMIMGVTPCSHDFDLGPGFDNVFPHASADHVADQKAVSNNQNLLRLITTFQSYFKDKQLEPRKNNKNKNFYFHHTGCLIGILHPQHWKIIGHRIPGSYPSAVMFFHCSLGIFVDLWKKMQL